MGKKWGNMRKTMGKNHGKHGTNDRKHRKHYEKHGSKDRTHRKKYRKHGRNYGKHGENWKRKICGARGENHGKHWINHGKQRQNNGKHGKEYGKHGNKQWEPWKTLLWKTCETLETRCSPRTRIQSRKTLLWNTWFEQSCTFFPVHCRLWDPEEGGVQIVGCEAKGYKGSLGAPESGSLRAPDHLEHHGIT